MSIIHRYFIIIFHLVARPRRRCRGPGAVYILLPYLRHTPSSRRLILFIYDDVGTNVQYVHRGYTCRLIQRVRNDCRVRSHIIRSLRPITAADTKLAPMMDRLQCYTYKVYADRTRDTRNTYDIVRTIYYNINIIL